MAAIWASEIRWFSGSSSSGSPLLATSTNTRNDERASSGIETSTRRTMNGNTSGSPSFRSSGPLIEASSPAWRRPGAVATDVPPVHCVERRERYCGAVQVGMFQVKPW
jgi:hypothetical protein